MQIKSRLQINVVLSVVTALVCCIVLYSTQFYRTKANRSLKIAGEINTSVLERVTFRNDYIRNNNVRAKEQWFVKHREITGLLQSATGNANGPEDETIINNLKTHQETIGKIFSAIVANRGKSVLNTGPSELSRDVEDRLLTQLNMNVYEVVVHCRQLLELSEKAREAAIRASGWGISSAFLLMVAVTLFNSWSLNRAIAERLARLQSGIAILGEGNLEHRIDIKGDNELADISRAFNEMTEKLRSTYHDLEREIVERKQVEQELLEAHAQLEDRVHERTKELIVAKNALKEYIGTLEQRVSERTAQLQAANDSMRASRLAALNLMQDAVEARTQAEESAISLQASEQRMQQALQVSRSFTFEWHPGTDLVIRSESCGTVLNLSGDDIVNDTGANFFQRIHPEDRARFGLILSGLSPASSSYTTEYRVVRNDGSEIVLEETGLAMFDDSGTLEKLVGVSTDITARKHAENALLRLKDELEQRVADRTMELAESINSLQSEIRERELAEISLRKETSERLQALESLRENEQLLIQQSRQAAMGEMIGNIAHQWRQPLNTLGLYTQSLNIFYESPQFNKEFLDTSVAKSMEIIKHMSNTIDDFRNYFKPEREKANFNVSEAVNSTLSLMEGSFLAPKILIEIVKNDNPVINGYKNEFAQVLLNILVNARDAIVANEINDARIIITICTEGSSAVVTVADNAGGIPEEIITKVFDPYFTTKGPQQGTGVGLFMSKTIIEKNMGGKLAVRNTDLGAEFRIEVEYGI